MKNLEEARKEIDDIDGRLVPLLKRRLEIAGDVLRAKIEKGLPILDPAREREVMARVAEEIGADYYAKDAKQSADIAKRVLG